MPIWVVRIRPAEPKNAEFPAYDYGFGSSGFGNDTQHMQALANWNRHPDGVGYIFPCKPIDGSFVVFQKPADIPNPETDQWRRHAEGDTINPASNQYVDLEKYYSEKVAGLRTKKGLGELTEEAYWQQVHALQDGVRSALYSFADRY